jgi:predicted house-cleaning noncanonical NTP pyrophosphatase (MazG superfamily)
MAAPAHSKIVGRLVPTNTIVFVSESKVVELAPDAISCENVGQKTFGLASLPQGWTLPFFGISAELFRRYASAPKARKKLLTQWEGFIASAASQVGIDSADEVLVRSSGSGEGIATRGKFHSAIGALHSIEFPLAGCMEKLAADADLREECIPLLIQKRCRPEKAKGHLSNERRCYEENRDWMGEIESPDTAVSSNFQINLRRWREKLPQKLPHTLSCSLSTHISEVLKIPADWTYRKGARVHFEWVWDGRFVYLVQADEESNWDGHDPIQEHRDRNYNAVALAPRCLRRVSADDDAAARFGKVANVFTYLKLKLPTAPLYILDDQKIIRQLSAGRIPAALRADISQMVKGSLVIRTDLATSDMPAKQLLPRTQEVRAASEAVEWITAQSKVLCKSNHDGAFIFHNFIPAQSAAFAYADPKEPLVQIEALWGLPEGLYYNSHDKYVIDTMKADIGSVSPDAVSKFSVREKRNFKHFFVSTTPSGKWETLSLKPPYDWKGSLSDEDCRRIAYESRRIAKAQGHAVSIMWFIGVPASVADCSAIPWYHEAFDVTASRPTLATRTKTPFDKLFVIRSAKDLEELRKGPNVSTPVNRIRVQPLDEKLLRDRSTLRKIGELAKATGAIIVLEGAVLSHAYYQLLSTGAIVEVVHPFIGFEERHGFNKLVRDRVPELIRQRGESVTTAQLDSEAFIRALREKLVEEAYELLDAKDLRSVVAELADVREVVGSLIQKLNITEDEVNNEQVRKRDERGGFSKGIVLVETESKPPTSKPVRGTQEHFKELQPSASNTKMVDETEVRRRSELLDKRTDRRVAEGKVEIKASISVPVTRGVPWMAETGEERIEGTKGKIVTGRIKGARNGSQWNIEVSICIDETQLEML